MHLSILLPLLALSTSPTTPHQEETLVISTRTWHLGDDSTPEWPEAAAAPDGQRIDLVFEGRAFAGEGTLELRQRHVNDPWHVLLNGQRVATLERSEPLETHYYAIPAGVLVDGENTFTLVGDVPGDDITVGEIRLHLRSFRELFDLRRVEVRVVERESATPLPARVTVLDSTGALAPLFYAERLSTAVRTGVVYTCDGLAGFELPPGDYRVFALRGTEWSLAQAPLPVTRDLHRIQLELTRELDTTGFVACDTHIHTLTHSGHGDSSVEERQVTLAGEGIELAIATDHNHNTDYRPFQERMGLTAYYTPVVGNEVTTPIGHLNAFPLDPRDEVPPWDLHDMGQIVEGIRERGAIAITLNHPRWPDHDTGPHGVMQIDHHSGEWAGDWTCTYDALELINSDTEEPEPLLLFRDWFALLNRGIPLSAVGSSDSHTVGVVVGQGRTYVRSSTDDPAAIDVIECSRNIAAGHSSISMGIFVDARLGERSVLGETLPGDALGHVELRVAAPSWVTPRRLLLFANGRLVHESPITHPAGGEGMPKPLDVTLPMDPSLDWPTHDYWLVAVVMGDDVGGAWWPLLNDYTLAATNPLFFDVDGDGACASARAQALEIVRAGGIGPEVVRNALGRVDTAVAAQLLHLVRLEYLRRAHEQALELGRDVADRHPGLVEWLEGLDPLD